MTPRPGRRLVAGLLPCGHLDPRTMFTYDVTVLPAPSDVTAALGRWRGDDEDPRPPLDLSWSTATAGEIRAHLAGALRADARKAGQEADDREVADAFAQWLRERSDRGDATIHDPAWGPWIDATGPAPAPWHGPAVPR